MKVSRRAWCGNQNAFETIEDAMKRDEKLHVTLPNKVEDISVVEKALKQVSLI